MLKKAKMDIREKMDRINLDEEEEDYTSKSIAKSTPAKKRRTSYIPKGKKEVEQSPKPTTPKRKKVLESEDEMEKVPPPKKTRAPRTPKLTITTGNSFLHYP